MEEWKTVKNSGLPYTPIMIPRHNRAASSRVVWSGLGPRLISSISENADRDTRCRGASAPAGLEGGTNTAKITVRSLLRMPIGAHYSRGQEMMPSPKNTLSKALHQSYKV